MSNKLDYNCPKLTVDIIIETRHVVTLDQPSPIATNPTIVIIARKFEPKTRALPGGFVDYGESPWQAAIREAKEETNLSVRLREMFHVYGNPIRDPRVHATSIVFVAEARSEKLEAKDDAKSAVLLTLAKARQLDLAFDHALILSDYAHYLKHGVRPDWNR